MKNNNTKNMLGACLLLLAPIISASASAGPVEEAFVREKASEGLQILGNSELDAAAKEQAFGAFVDQVTNGPKVARFVLGKYARGLDKQVLAEFQDAFSIYAKGIYQGNLSRYGGENFMVTGSVDRKPGDAIVNSVISGGAVKEPLQVRWRVRTRDGVSKVIDLEAFGIWLAIQQRSEITTYIANHNGSVLAATKMLVAKSTPVTVTNNNDTNHETADRTSERTSDRSGESD